MIEFLQELTKLLREINEETYYDRNRKKEVVYPYATFDFDSEPISRNQDGFYLDIDIFDLNSSYIRIIDLEDKFKDKLLFRRILMSNMYLRFSFLGSSKVPTNDENLKRRNVRLYIKIDWRDKHYGITKNELH
ncbi:hypothetical protein [Enterococcus nangangensis]|uniref:hypothetical protein n=1 Tax=Enterococcus nangangensis TaxID=2559926 RepID=UPI0010F77604|nr:hypothetical protein [Enterococcus nangangensis]